jgi:hypothetical protein
MQLLSTCSIALHHVAKINALEKKKQMIFGPANSNSSSFVCEFGDPVLKNMYIFALM